MATKANKKIKLSNTPCRVCGIMIPQGRIDAIPHADTCTEHSTTAPVYGVTYLNGTSADDGETELMILKDPDQINSYKAAKANVEKSLLKGGK